MRRIVFALALVVVAACSKKKPLTDTLPADEVTSDDMVRELKRVQDGEMVGQLLMVPKVELDYRGITVNGRLVVPASELDTTKLTRIEKFRTWLRGLKEHWKQIHPGDDFNGLIELDAASEADALVGESVIETAGSAGFIRARLKIDETKWDAMLGVPRPPQPDQETTTKKTDARLRVRRALVGFDVDVLNAGPCAREPNVKSRVVKGDALAAIVDETCAGVESCLLSIEASPGALLTIAKIIAPAYSAGRPTNVYLDFFPGEGAAVVGDAGVVGGTFENAWPNVPFIAWLGDPPSSSGGIGLGVLVHPPDAGPPLKKPAKVTPGVVQVSGKLGSDVVDKVVHARLDGVRACYEEELRRYPTLTGRVTVKLAVDASGAVAQSCNGGSDLPSTTVVQCVVKAASKLAFPAPESGIATVVVPYVMSPPDASR